VIGNIAHFWRITRELDINALREEFDRNVCIRVLGTDADAARRVARLIEPDPQAGDVDAGVLGRDGSLRGADLFVIAIDGPIEADARRALSELSVRETPLVLVQLDTSNDVLVLGVPQERMVALDPTVDDTVAREQLFAALVPAAPEVLLAVGRRHPLLREPVADYLIRDTSRVNAQFAALSSLPANIPLLGGLVGDMADMLVLTKNQVLLLFKLGGLYGRDLELGRQLIAEVMPIVGGAFLWRTTARTLVGLVPGMLGAVPKTLVAYSGTYVVGQMARYYYQYGRKPPPDFARRLRADAKNLLFKARL
jgi:uncharacterized protein (DUF697 family)